MGVQGLPRSVGQSCSSGSRHVRRAFRDHRGEHASFWEPDQEVEAVYTSIEPFANKNCTAGRRTILAGDINAEVGGLEVDFDYNAIGGDSHVGSRNERGTGLLQWCTLRTLFLQNTFCKGYSKEQLYMYKTSNIKLDFIVVDSTLRRNATSCQVEAWFDTGSDHRPLQLNIRVAGMPPAAPRSRNVWTNDTNLIEYHRAMDRRSSLVSSDTLDPNPEALPIEQTLIDACLAAAPPRERVSQRPKLANPEIAALISQRRALQCSGGLELAQKKSARRDVTARMRRAIRRDRRQKDLAKIDRILNDFKGVRNLPLEGKVQTKQRITFVTDSGGFQHISPGEIANVFASFYEELYRSGLAPPSHTTELEPEPPPDFDMGGLHDAPRSVKSDRCPDEQGIVSEMLKDSSDGMGSRIPSLRNGVLQLSVEPPDSWRRNRLVVILKKGEPDQPNKYRPNQFCTSFSREWSAICFRQIPPRSSLHIKLRIGKGFSTENNLLAMDLLTERCKTWNQHLWL